MLKISQSVVFQRREKIMQMLNNEKRVNVNELANYFAVSEMTIRRDLMLLEKKKLIRRVYGGAEIVPENINYQRSDSQIIDSLKHDIMLKKKLARVAEDMVEDGMTVYINAGTTTYYLIERLVHKKIKIVTNNLNAFIDIDAQNAELNISGGLVSGNKKTLIGDGALHSFMHDQADICFLGVTAVDDVEISSFSLMESLLNRTILEHTKGDKVIITNSAKLGRRDNFMVAKLNLFSHLITDSNADSAVVKKIANKGVKVLLIE